MKRPRYFPYCREGPNLREASFVLWFCWAFMILDNDLTCIFGWSSVLLSLLLAWFIRWARFVCWSEPFFDFLLLSLRHYREEIRLEVDASLLEQVGCVAPLPPWHRWLDLSRLLLSLFLLLEYLGFRGTNYSLFTFQTYIVVLTYVAIGDKKKETYLMLLDERDFSSWNC